MFHPAKTFHFRSINTKIHGRYPINIWTLKLGKHAMFGERMVTKRPRYLIFFLAVFDSLDFLNKGANVFATCLSNDVMTPFFRRGIMTVTISSRGSPNLSNFQLERQKCSLDSTVTDRIRRIREVHVITDVCPSLNGGMEAFQTLLYLTIQTPRSSLANGKDT